MELAREFSRFGPLASVKILYSKNDKETQKPGNSCNINFMRRDDAKECIAAVDKKSLFGQTITAQLSHRLPKMNFPLEIKSEKNKNENDQIDVGKLDEAESIKVEPLEDVVVRRIVEAVAKAVAIGGNSLEQNIIEMHKSDSKFEFISNNSKENIYYRWKLYSLAQGDNWDNWRIKPFRMVSGGRIWVPPSIESVKKANKIEYLDVQSTAQIPNVRERRKNIRFLSDKKREELEDILRNITRDRKSIRSAMGFCIDNSENAIEIVETITESLTLEETEITSKIARLLLVSDVLHNSDSKVRNSSAYRTEFQRKLEEIFKGLYKSYSKIDGRMTADKMREDVLTLLRVWHAWSLFPARFLDGLESIFMMKSGRDFKEDALAENEETGELNGVPLDEEGIDGFVLNDL